MKVTTWHGHYRGSDEAWCGQPLWQGDGNSYGDPTYWASHYGKTYQDEFSTFSPCKDCEKTKDSILALLGALT
jgi:hypothetical protein